MLKSKYAGEYTAVSIFWLYNAGISAIKTMATYSNAAILMRETYLNALISLFMLRGSITRKAVGRL